MKKLLIITLFLSVIAAGVFIGSTAIKTQKQITASHQAALNEIK
jgi:hypothetical protein